MYEARNLGLHRPLVLKGMHSCTILINIYCHYLQVWVLQLQCTHIQRVWTQACTQSWHCVSFFNFTAAPLHLSWWQLFNGDQRYNKFLKWCPVYVTCCHCRCGAALREMFSLKLMHHTMCSVSMKELQDIYQPGAARKVRRCIHKLLCLHYFVFYIPIAIKFFMYSLVIT